ncbi:hypothetical protein Bbelb_095140 [Branchiostoma belcheri]|nr:hypothetical protein Bbelb_095140 [Branchiostoma belcheri]
MRSNLHLKPTSAGDLAVTLQLRVLIPARLAPLPDKNRIGTDGVTRTANKTITSAFRRVMGHQHGDHGGGKVARNGRGQGQHHRDRRHTRGDVLASGSMYDDNKLKSTLFCLRSDAQAHYLDETFGGLFRAKSQDAFLIDKSRADILMEHSSPRPTPDLLTPLAAKFGYSIPPAVTGRAGQKSRLSELIRRAAVFSASLAGQELARGRATCGLVV